MRFFRCYVLAKVNSPSGSTSVKGKKMYYADQNLKLRQVTKVNAQICKHKEDNEN